MQEGGDDDDEEHQVEDRFSLGDASQEREGGKNDGSGTPQSNPGYHDLVLERHLPWSQCEKDGDRPATKMRKSDIKSRNR